MIYGQCGSKAIISSYSDLQKLSPDSSCVHFRKFVSRRLVLEVLKRCKKLESISISKSALKRCDSGCRELILGKNIKLVISNSQGRPSLVEKSAGKIWGLLL